MSNENKKPWYMDPTYLTIIAIIAAAIISSPIWIQMIFPPPSPPPDFSIVIDSMKGAVSRGGVISTAITIRGIQGYEHPVSLSASEQPSDVVVTFIPPIGGPTPSYTANVLISVDSSVPVGIYTIIIKGTGADGKEHSCKYILTVVTPMSVTPTPTLAITPTPTPTPPVVIKTEAGWEYQTHLYSQGITAVHSDPEEDKLVLQAHLIDGDPNYSKGQIYLDLRYADVPDLREKVPINMVGKKISALVKVPKDFVGDPSHPNGVQVFAKDSDWKSQYGPWKNIQRPNTWITVTLSPAKEKIPMGYTDKGFDPTDIIMIGVKFGMGTSSNAKYDGPLYVKDIHLY